MLLVRSYRTLAPLPVREASPLPSAVYFCGTVLTVTRTGRYPASLAIGEPGLSSTKRSSHLRGGAAALIAITSPAFAFHNAGMGL
jgi:hypothetical protein